ncbi:thermosome subunit [Candidatus Bathyarchaeota archaeon ex4484_205]|nr:MAG: thermosome subunit [Candidatus Bathyarchaeota archaeon ex4484_205]RLG68605.1 MAG: thermosome subunit [archaeon]
MAVAPTAAGTPILILKEGSTRSKGREAQRNNITAAMIVSDLVRSSLGPRGMDKMLVDSLGDVVITNDGATILKEMEIEHPAAKMMVEVAKTTDAEVGDGTTSATVLAGELLKKAADLLDQDVHPSIIVDGYRRASAKALKILKDIAEKVDPIDKKVLKKIAMTSMASKIVKENSEELADIVVNAILEVAEERDGKYHVTVDDVKVEKKAGASLSETKLIRGIVLDKEVVHSGMPKRVEGAKIALLNCPLEIEKTEFDAKINIQTPDQIKAFIDEEQRILKEMVDKIVSTGANVVICQKGIDDVAQHYLAKAGVLAVRRAKESDMEKLSKATGARIVTRVDDLSSDDLGYAGLVEERKVGEDKWVFIEECKNPKSVTILIRGGTEKIVDEAERAIHDALSVVKDVVITPYIVAGGGSPEIEVALKLRDFANTVGGKEQLAVQKFAEAIEIIPAALAENAGMDPIDILSELRSKHEQGDKWAGVDVFHRKVTDMWKLDIIEPLSVKEQIIKSASEAACMILRIDDVIAAGKLKEEKKEKEGPEESMPEFD